MKIEDKRQGSTTLEQLAVGVVFEAELDDEREVFVTTNKVDEYGGTVCVNLHTGKVYGFSKAKEVTILNTKLVIED